MSTSRGDMKLVTHPDRSPAVDFITRSSEGPFVDTGVDVLLRTQPGNPIVTERVYLARNTIRQLAQLAGIESDAADTASDQEAHFIAQGKLEGLKEGLGDDLVNVARTLRRWLDAAGVGNDRRSRT